MASEGGRSAAVATIFVALSAISAAAAFSAAVYWRRSRRLAYRVQELEASLRASLDKAASERRGRTRAQQALRNALLSQQCVDDADAKQASPPAALPCSYPMAPIGAVQSCFSTRNGTPRQPLLVPLARACMVLDPSRAPPEALEGLAEYSHCWILYVFHLNTDLDKLWKQRSRSKFKAKVRVPRLKGGKMGVLATRSPHRPCPIGLTVAKVEAVDGRAILFSGVDLVDGTPVLDIKPYLPYSDFVEGATVPKWLEEDNRLAVASVSFSSEFSSSLAECWEVAGKHSMYASPDELTSLIKQALSWDIRSFAQQSRPHHVGSNFLSNAEDVIGTEAVQDSNGNCDIAPFQPYSPHGDVEYHLVLESIDFIYKIDANTNVVVEKAVLLSSDKNARRDVRNWKTWTSKPAMQT